MVILTALPYSAEHYDSLPDIMDAAESLASSGVLSSLASSIGSIFVKHGTEDIFGLILLHRHFDMEPTERLVEFGNVSVPWDVTSNGEEMGKIQPVSWRFVGGGIVPYEFTANQLGQLLEGCDYDAFVNHLSNALQSMRLDHTFGLCRMTSSAIHGHPTMEFTSGRANVTVPDSMWALDCDSAAVEAAWQFGSQGKQPVSCRCSVCRNPGLTDMVLGRDLPGSITFKRCKNKCQYKASTGSHVKRHVTTSNMRC